MKTISERNAHPHFGKNHFQDNFKKGFVYKDVKEYCSLKEWLDNVFLAMNENYNLKKPNGNWAYILDKRLGIVYSQMKFFISPESQKELMGDEGCCVEFLTAYYHKFHRKSKKSK